MKIKDDSANVARQLERDFLSIGKFAATPNDKNCLSPTRTHSNLTGQFPYPIMYSFGTLYSTGTVSFISSHSSVISINEASTSQTQDKEAYS